MKGTIWVLPVYVMLAATLVSLNVVLFQLGDPGVGTDPGAAIQIYAPLWLTFYAPPLIAGWLIISSRVTPHSRQHLLLFVHVVLVLTLLELSFITDAHWTTILVEWVILLAVAYAMRRLLIPNHVGKLA